ncbi:unnamed protein product [Cyclocybe aegerita]|uniref:Uncharacterized protein n=1 Tax=Cyclocybe aegerita TaxID=1973307 RepID=A0A8S0XKL2_CYCAE|nr:unnamed protein product [Cyclocybe aegerita]
MADIRKPQDKPTHRVSTNVNYNTVKPLDLPGCSLPAIHRTHSVGSASVASTSPSCTPSEREWTRLHYFLDRLSFLAVTCSKATLQAMLDKVRVENEQYDRRAMGREDYIRRLNVRSEPFSSAEYEMVILHPSHFLPIGSGMLMHAPDPQNRHRLVRIVYTISPDGALRQDEDDNSQRFSSFSPFPRPESNPLNPFLVVLNADMAFRRFERSKQFFATTLCQEYQDLVDLTTQLADAIYHSVIVGRALYAAEAAQSLAIQKEEGKKGKEKAEKWDGDGDVDMAPADEFGVKTGAGDRASLTPKGRGGGGTRAGASSSRFVASIEKPAPEASPEDVKDYCRFLISGRDRPLTAEDKAILASVGVISSNDKSDSEGSDADSEESLESDDDDNAIPQRPHDGALDTATTQERVLQWQASSIAA